MTYFPDKPWNIGDEFENETTGVTYRYDGTKWVATGDSSPNVDYLPLTGGNMSGDIKMSYGNHIDSMDANGQNFRFLTFNAAAGLDYQGGTSNDNNVINRKAMVAYVDDYLPLTGGNLTGKLNINVNSGEALTINNDKIKFWSSGAVALKGYTNFKDDELVTKKYVDDTVANSGGGGSSYTPPTFYQSNVGYENIVRPGEFGMRDRNDQNTTFFSNARSIWFTYTDKDGATPFIHGTSKDWTGYFTGPCYLMKDGEVIWQVAAGSGVNQFVLLDGALNSYGIYYLAWTDDSVAQATAGFTGLTQGGQYQLHIPSLIKP